METTTNNDVTVMNATAEFLHSQIAQKDQRITQLEEHVQNVTQRSYNEAAERSRMRNEMQEWTLEQLDEDSITQSQAEEIASICGFELSKEVEVEVTVQYSITVNLPHGEDIQNIIHDIDFDSVSYSDDKITWLSSSIDRIDF